MDSVIAGRHPRINPAVTHMDESIIREMTRVAEESDAVNLAQGFPEYPIAEDLHRVLAGVRMGRQHGQHQHHRTWTTVPRGLFRGTA